MTGRIHIYTGDGKGKTTACTGLAVRFAGSGQKVVFTQFLKDDQSSELTVLSGLPEVIFLPAGKKFGFTWRMSPEEKLRAKAFYTVHFKAAVAAAVKEAAGMLVLDEVIGACGTGMLEETVVLEFLYNKPEALEVVMSGRNASDQLIAAADYVSEICKIKHPYEQGISARKGIEF